MMLPSAVLLPVQPALALCVLARSAREDPPLGGEELPGLVVGEYLRLFAGAPDGGWVYGCSLDGAREGWLRGDQIRPLSLAEVAAAVAAGVPASLPLRAVLRRATLVRVHEDWQEPREPTVLELRAGDLVQLSTVRDGWGYGWPLDCPSRRGWFPLASVEVVNSSVDALVPRPRDQQELTPGATAARQALVREASSRQPPRRPPAWEGDLPAVVAESNAQAEREYRDRLDHFEVMEGFAQNANGGQDSSMMPGGLANGAGDGGPRVDSLLEPELPEDCYPLVVCKMPFLPPKGTSGALLPMEVGDLVRVTSSLEAVMYHGFHEGKTSQRGWFPKKHTNLLEDPFGSEIDHLPVQIGPPPLPRVPEEFLQRRAMA